MENSAMPHGFHSLHGQHGPTTQPVAQPDSEPRTATLLDPRRWWVLALLGAAQFMLIIDVTVVNVALPSIGRDLHLDRSQLTWIVTAYTLLFGSLLMLGGRLADTFGRRRVFLAGLLTFVAASTASGLAPSGNVLVVTRALQGVGAALLSPSALSMVTTIFQEPERNRALAVWAALGGTGAAVGVILGGALTSGPGWQWIFFINVPVGIAVGLGITRLVPSSAGPRAGMGIDLVGGVTIAAAIGLMLWAVINAGDAGWLSAPTLAPIGLGIVLAGLFVRREQTARDPLVRLDLLADRTISVPIVLLVTASMLLAGMIFLNSLYLQAFAGHSALDTGLLFVPMALAVIAGSQVGVALIGHAGGRLVSSAGLIAVAIGMGYLTRLPTTGDVLVDVLPGLMIVAFGLGNVLVAAQTTAFSRVSDQDAGVVSGLVNTSHEVGFALGVAVLSTIGGASLTAGPAGGGGGFTLAFQAAGVLAVVAAVAMLHLMPSGQPAATGRRIFAH
jgi:EmrB/QacA subfamily drug resistance transporter